MSRNNLRSFVIWSQTKLDWRANSAAWPYMAVFFVEAIINLRLLHRVQVPRLLCTSIWVFLFRGMSYNYSEMCIIKIMTKKILFNIQSNDRLKNKYFDIFLILFYNNIFEQYEIIYYWCSLFEILSSLSHSHFSQENWFSNFSAIYTNLGSTLHFNQHWIILIILMG